MSRGTPTAWLRDRDWKFGKKPLKVQCPACDGRGVRFVETIFTDCPDCDGRGFIRLAGLIADAIVGLALFVALAVMVVMVAP